MDTHIFIGGLIGADQVSMEAREAHYGPDREETHHHLQHSAAIMLRKNSLMHLLDTSKATYNDDSSATETYKRN